MSDKERPPSDGHNHSAQQGVDRNPDPVLTLANEHHHPHLHHGATALPPEKDDVMFATSTDQYTTTAPAGSPDLKVHPMSSRDDEESGGVGEIRADDHKNKSGGFLQKLSIKRLYKQYKLVFHLAIWSVWTACVSLSLYINHYLMI